MIDDIETVFLDMITHPHGCALQMLREASI